MKTAPGFGRPLPPTRPSRLLARRLPRERRAAVGGVRAVAAWAVPYARRKPPRARCDDGAAERSRRVHTSAGRRVDLGGAGVRHHRLEPGREGRVLRPGRRQGLPAPDLLPGSGRCRAPVNDLFAYTLRLGDDALIAAQRTAEWIAAAPQLEEDVALGNIGLDQLGQARSLLQYAGEVEGAGRSEDDLAYFRDEREFVNLQLCELPNGDFAFAMARLLYFATYQQLLYDELRSRADETLAGVAGEAGEEGGDDLQHLTLRMVWRGRRSRRSRPASTMRRNGCCGWGMGPTRATGECRLRWTRSGRTPRRCFRRTGWCSGWRSRSIRRRCRTSGSAECWVWLTNRRAAGLFRRTSTAVVVRVGIPS